MIYEGDKPSDVASRFSKAFEFFCIVMRLCLVSFFLRRLVYTLVCWWIGNTYGCNLGYEYAVWYVTCAMIP